MNPTQSKKAQRLENLAHYLAAFVIFMKGIDKVGVDGKTGLGIFFMVLAVLLLLGTIFHHRAVKTLKHFKAFVLITEIIVISIVGVLYMNEGKQYIQYVCFATAILFLVSLSYT